MAKKTPAKSSKTWSPGDPLNFDKAIQQNTPIRNIADKLERADDALFSQASKTNRSITPTNHKPFNARRRVRR